MTYRYTPPFGLRLLQLVILLEAMFRGFTYIVRPDTVMATTDVTKSAPMEVWGVIFVVFAIIGLFGEALMSGVPIDQESANGRAWPAFIAHAGLMIMYLTLSLAYTDAVFSGEFGLASAPVAMLVFAFIHWLFARRRKAHAT
ncbi:membrane protein [Mycobacterium phage Eaglepride]|nr:membrane protein [Mycobacterium phage Eaglepride]